MTGLVIASIVCIVYWCIFFLIGAHQEDRPPPIQAPPRIWRVRIRPKGKRPPIILEFPNAGKESDVVRSLIQQHVDLKRVDAILKPGEKHG